MKLSRNELLTYIKKTKPTLIYLSGKTSTGKTAFSNTLNHKLGYTQIEFDQIVLNSIAKYYSISNRSQAFVVVYRGTGPQIQVKSFITSARKTLLRALKNGFVVTEGAIANPNILKRIFSDELKDFLFIYFQPVNQLIHARRIKERFIKGASDGTTRLPKTFWAGIKTDEFEQYLKTKKITPPIEKSIQNYSRIAIEDSKERLKSFQQNFPNIIVVKA